MNTPFVYTKLVEQPLSITFCFADRFGSEWDTSGLHRQLPDDTEGLIQFTLWVAGQQYGPYTTAHKTTYGAYSMRKAFYPTKEAERIQAQIRALDKRLLDAWRYFPNKQAQINGEMILNRAGLKVFSVAEGGALYVI